MRQTQHALAADRLLRLPAERQSTVLHRKETFLPPAHPLLAKFARLTRQEEQHGLLDDSSTIGTRAGWQARLAESGFRLAGHRLLRAK